VVRQCDVIIIIDKATHFALQLRKETDRVFVAFAAQMVATWHLWPFCCILLSRGCILVPSSKNTVGQIRTFGKTRN